MSMKFLLSSSSSSVSQISLFPRYSLFRSVSPFLLFFPSSIHTEPVFKRFATVWTLSGDLVYIDLSRASAERWKPFRFLSPHILASSGSMPKWVNINNTINDDISFFIWHSRLYSLLEKIKCCFLSYKGFALAIHEMTWLHLWCCPDCKYPSSAIICK